ncbi:MULTISPECIES: hypothetical protein [Rhodopseudomonas]|uniref:Uncharacterized protein n=1 Tax=Rhodopseudomonas palustris (strain DX-1) TaxID=652103 RepID=E6VLW1_RHOPX|nr:MULTISPECIES: hypothetical protein [Rhodopseudomonas]NEW86366.1 hypothetical protein [Rhodopseudomonas sp. WA056]QDL97281.1 hypothetical protein FLL57_08170 [Rhodopseudomonas palustris]
MKPVMIAAVILALSGGAALAQSGTSAGAGGSTTSPGSSISGADVRQAPIGHRQPRRDDTPPEQRIDQIDPADAALDRKIKSICRGC